MGFNGWLFVFAFLSFANAMRDDAEFAMLDEQEGLIGEDAGMEGRWKKKMADGEGEDSRTSSQSTITRPLRFEQEHGELLG